MGYMKGLAIFVTAGTILGGATAVALDLPFCEERAKPRFLYFKTVEEINEEKLSGVNSEKGIVLRGDKPISAEIVAEALKMKLFLEIFHEKDGFTYYIGEDNTIFRNFTESQFENAPSFMLPNYIKIGDVEHFSEATMDDIRKICINKEGKYVGVFFRGNSVYVSKP